MASSSSSFVPAQRTTREEMLVDTGERVMVMRVQEEAHYSVPDYLAAEWQRKLREAADAGADDTVADGGAVRPTSSAAAFPSAATVSPSSTTADPTSNANAGPPSSNSSSSSSSQINELWREKICEWCYQVVDHFDFNREVVSVAMSYLDRYLATRTVNRRIFQLAAMTALYLAIKLFEPGKLRMSSLIDLSRGYFLAEHIVTMEDSMLGSLNWRVHPPTPFAFCRDLARLLPRGVGPRARHDVGELARFMTELSVCDYWFVTRRPSSVALASLLNAIELQGPHGGVDPGCKAEFLRKVVEMGMDISGDGEIVECYERLREMYDAGGYTPDLEEDAAGEDDPADHHRVATVSPTGALDGPDAVTTVTDDDEMEGMDCV
mmetsp:Transcript_39672/g.95425  ORF Transcript_39672/g.95425 Transcript_39672/m.95425 type:complete len:378 (+) Transcript_39672:387-1520(+)